MTHAWQSAAEAVVAEWGIDATQAGIDVVFVSQSENFVFRVRDDDGRQYVLRLHRPGYHNRSELDAEHIWIQALAEAGLKVPCAHRTSDDSGYAIAKGPDGSRFAGLYDWEDGQILSEVLASDNSQLAHWYEQIGTTAARMHLTAMAFKPDDTFVRHAFDAEGTMGDQPFWGRFWDDSRHTSEDSEYLNDLRNHIHRRLKTLPTSSDTYGMIHADMHANNVLTTDDEIMVIDFDDAGFGWYQFDLAVALPEHDSPHHGIAADALIRGYQSVRSMSPQFFESIPLFQLIRSMNHIGWFLARYDLPQKHLRSMVNGIRERVVSVIPDFDV